MVRLIRLNRIQSYENAEKAPGDTLYLPHDGQLVDDDQITGNVNFEDESRMQLGQSHTLRSMESAILMRLYAGRLYSKQPIRPKGAMQWSYQPPYSHGRSGEDTVPQSRVACGHVQFDDTTHLSDRYKE